jgi:hypothetical protein
MVRPASYSLVVVVLIGLLTVAGRTQERGRTTDEDKALGGDRARELGQATAPFRKPPDLSVLSQAKWDQIDRSIKRALNWLASRQDADGSFPTHASGQPAVTSLAVLALLSAGEKPSVGEHGKRIDRAIDYVLSCQREDNLFVVDSTDMGIPPYERGSHTANYNHAIAELMLCEAYGSTDAARRLRMEKAIERGIAFARRMQLRKQPFPEDQGGFRYFKPGGFDLGNGDADLSVTVWFVMFYRSAKNAGFEIPEDYINEATAYVHRCYDPDRKVFTYNLNGRGRQELARGMTGAGIVCLAMGGKPDADIGRAAGQWLVEHPFDRYGEFVGFFDRFHYGAYHCSQAMFWLGGDYWAKFYPTTAETLMANQNPDGSWPPEAKFKDGIYGSEYTTALAVLTLTSPFQLLPIHQR